MYKEIYSTFFDKITPQENPFVKVIAGSPGSGKTTKRREIHAQLTNVYLHDMDEVLIRLSGYQRDLEKYGNKKAFEKWMPIARDIADWLVQHAFQEKYSVLYDRTCGADGTYRDLLRAKESGYHIHMTGFCIDPNIAYDRILAREKEAGRTVSRSSFLRSTVPTSVSSGPAILPSSMKPNSTTIQAKHLF